jgi:hypothetical protein
MNENHMSKYNIHLWQKNFNQLGIEFSKQCGNKRIVLRTYVTCLNNLLKDRVVSRGWY